jgi:hypothetical protein
VTGPITLYRARGDQVGEHGLYDINELTPLQLERYGYAAFGLTVIPYVTMSLVNLIAHLATPHYSAMYLVHSPEMDEAIERGGIFEGAVGRAEPKTPDAETLAGTFEKGNNGEFTFRCNGKLSEGEPKSSGQTPLIDSEGIELDVHVHGEGLSCTLLVPSHTSRT